MKKAKKISIILAILLVSIVALTGCVGFFTPESDSPTTGRVTDDTTNIPNNSASGHSQYPVNNNNLDTAVKINFVVPDSATEPLLEDTIAKIHPSVVEINAIVSGGTSAGSGIFVSISANYAYILTCQHVVDSATAIKVILTNGEKYDAYYVGGLGDQDIAVIKIKAIPGLTSAKTRNLETKPLRLGEDAIAIGNPLGQLGGSVTKGIISSTVREINMDGTVLKLLQTDAAINSGNSGGGLFDRDGLLIGVVNAKATGENIEGLGFAIPVDTAVSIANSLIETANNPSNAYGGLGYVPNKVLLGVTTSKAVSQGTYYFNVAATDPYGCLTSGLDNPIATGDKIISANGNTFDENSNLATYVRNLAIGDTITLKVLRNVTSGWTTTQKEITITATIRQYTYGFVAK